MMLTTAFKNSNWLLELPAGPLVAGGPYSALFEWATELGRSRHLNATAWECLIVISSKILTESHTGINSLL